MARSPKTTTTDTTKVETQAVNPPVTLTPAALQAVIAEATRQSALKAEMQAALVAKPSTIINGKSERSIKNEIAAVKAFAKAGFKDAKPHVNIFTFRKWMERGYRPVEGSKSLKISNLRLFHVSQVRKITSEEKAAMQAQSGRTVMWGRLGQPRTLQIGVVLPPPDQYREGRLRSGLPGACRLKQALACEIGPK